MKHGLNSKTTLVTFRATTIQEWGQAIESNIDFCLKQGHGSKPRLSPAFRGRCQQVKFVRNPVMLPTKVACPGSYEPSCEVVSITTRRKVTQVRRLESLWRRLKKLESQGPTTDKTLAEITCEWKAVLRSHSFGSPFLHWFCTQHGFEFPAWPIPQAEWVYDALQFARFHLDSALQRDAKIQKAKAEYQRCQDQSNHNKNAFAIVRGPGLPRVQEIGRKHSADALIVAEDDGLNHTVYLDTPDAQQFAAEYAIHLRGIQAKVTSIEQHCLTVQTAEPHFEWENPTEVIQCQFAVHPADLAKHLDRFWKPIWNRDDINMDFIHMPSIQADFHAFLSNIPPRPDIQVDMLCPEEWTKAIKKLKANSAVGTDRISAQELKLLPASFIAKLAQIMASYDKGFPADFMHGLICPLSKTDGIPEARQTRPIMLLPQLYRLWAAVMTAQITRVLSTWVPQDITGLLPKRGAASTAYFAQFMIERARRNHQSISGITLDIIKCFNWKWDFTFHAMLALGIPKPLLVVWINSIHVLTRHWQLQNQMYTSGQGSTGFPEGDQFSVVAMIAISTSWTTSTRAMLSSPDTAFLSAYADNWSWVYAHVEDHLPTLQNTLGLMRAAGTAIDWDKTWLWTTCHRNASHIKDFVQQCIPGQQIQQKDSAADLGFQLQYSGNTELGAMLTRLQEGFQRLQRLQAMPHLLGVKETMLRTSVYPAALHGAEIKPPSIDHFQQLRTRSARALFGFNNSLSPAIALSCTKGGILDPEFWLTVKALFTARHFLLTQKPDHVQMFFRLCSKFQGTLSQVCGPASALAFLLRQLTLQLDAQGCLHVTAFLKFPILRVSKKRLLRYLEDAWMNKLIVMHTARFKWFHFPDISRVGTTKCLQAFADTKRWQLIREIAGGYQTASQKQKWLTTESGLCPHCNQPDSRYHRLVECPLGAHIREPYQAKLDHLIEQESLLLEFPVITIHPNLEAINLMQHQIPDAIWSDKILQLVRQKQRDNETLHWFTDGSCMLPSHVDSRFSAYAVILDLCHNDAERCAVADTFRYSPAESPTFVTACTARGQAEQDILRAETQAILAVALTIGPGVIHSDSQVAIHNVTLALQATNPAGFASCEHVDLLLRIWDRRQSIDLQFAKVKAHQDLPAVSDPLLRYWAIGNDFADRVAQHTCLHHMPDMVQTKQRMHAEYMTDLDNLQTVYRLHLELQDMRACVVKQQTDGLNIVQHDHRAICAAFASWKVEQSPRVFPAPDLEFVTHSAFGEEVAQQTCAWLQQLVWPETDEGPLGFSTGVTWIELGLSWMFTHQRFLPILRKDNRGTVRLVYPANFTAAKDQGFTCIEAGTMMQKITGNVLSLLVTSLWPEDSSRQKSSALYRMGSHRYHQGINLRPQFPHQDKVIELLQAAVYCQDKDGLSCTPSIPCLPRGDQIAPGTWQFRIDRAKLAMKRVWAKRVHV
eukprot:s28_g8.t1